MNLDNNQKLREIIQKSIDNNEQNIKLEEEYTQIKIKELEEEDKEEKIQEKYVEDKQEEEIENKQIENESVKQKSVGEIIREVSKNVGLNGLMVWLNFVISYSLFPGVMLKKNYTNISTSWHSAILIANYNLFGTIGKLLPTFKIYSEFSVSILVLSRFIFFLSFFLIVFHPSFSSYAFCQINVALFAFTEGYAQSAHLNLATSKLSKQFKKTLGAYIMGFPIQFGLLSGSLLGYIFKFYL